MLPNALIMFPLLVHLVLATWLCLEDWASTNLCQQVVLFTGIVMRLMLNCTRREGAQQLGFAVLHRWQLQVYRS